MRNLDMHPRLKLVVVGDVSVGKTSLLISYTTNEFPGPGYLYFHAYAESHTVDGKQYTVQLWDTPASADYDRLRPLAYPQTDVFIICFSVVETDSYENARTKWGPETAYHNPNCPVLLVGTKIDLRHDTTTLDNLHDRNVAPIQYQRGVAMYKDIGALCYLECSALTGYGVASVFEKAMRMGGTVLNLPK